MLESAGKTDPGCIRKNNEDFFGIRPDIGLYVVADGMGGAQAGETASRLAVETTVDFVAKAPERTAETLKQAFEQAHKKVLSIAASAIHLNGMGTTLVAVLEHADQLLVSSVGDSRVYLLHRGALQVITDDQTWANEMGRKIGLDEERLRSHPMRHVLTMAIGVEAELRINSYHLDLEPGDILLLCSDGLHGTVAPEMIHEILKKDATLDEKCNYLIEAARKAGGPDNITAVLLRKQ